MSRLALKVDVDTFRGTRIGVPQLVQLFRQYQVGATFLFSLGPDHTGRAIKRIFRPGFFGKVSRTSVVSHYGLKTLLYGTLLPGPDIGRSCKNILLGVRSAGFEVGIHCWDHVRWQDGVTKASKDWTAQEMRRAFDRFVEIFDEIPKVHGAAGWQMNSHAVHLTEQLGFSYASDCRGTHPFVPISGSQEIICPQLPTTLPTLDELIGIDGLNEDNVHERLLALTEDSKDHVYTLHAELEGMKLLSTLERLIIGWREQGYEICSMDNLATYYSKTTLPRCEIVAGEIEGRSGILMVQKCATAGS